MMFKNAGSFGIMVVLAIVANLVMLAAAVWLVVKVLQWTGVLS